MRVKCCKGCTERSVEPNCHSSCEKYRKLVQEYRAVDKAKKADAIVAIARLERRNKS